MTTADLPEQHLILFEAVSGSRAYGTHLLHPDTDLKSVFVLPQALAPCAGLHDASSQ